MPGTVKSELLPDADRSHKCDSQEKACRRLNLPLDKSHFITDTLYSQMYLNEWKKKYVELGVCDGTQWELKIKLTGKRERTYYGDNKYPPYWPELIKLFRKYM